VYINDIKYDEDLHIKQSTNIARLSSEEQMESEISSTRTCKKETFDVEYEQV
jgi:hypothetical protein